MSASNLPLNRRDFLGVAAVAGFAFTDGEPAERATMGPAPSIIAPLVDTASTTATLEDNIYTRTLGVRPHLGAHEHISRLGGGRMSREVLEAMAEANEFMVDMHQLNAAAGRRAAGRAHGVHRHTERQRTPRHVCSAVN